LTKLRKAADLVNYVVLASVIRR